MCSLLLSVRDFFLLSIIIRARCRERGYSLLAYLFALVVLVDSLQKKTVRRLLLGEELGGPAVDAGGAHIEGRCT